MNEKLHKKLHKKNYIKKIILRPKVFNIKTNNNAFPD